MKKIDVDTMPKPKEEPSKGEVGDIGRIPAQEWTDQLSKKGK